MKGYKARRKKVSDERKREGEGWSGKRIKKGGWVGAEESVRAMAKCGSFDGSY